MKLVLISLIILVSNYTSNGQLNQRVQELISNTSSENAVFGISVRSGHGSILYDYNAQSKFIPASTFKLVTTLSALEILGKESFYETRIGYTGELLTDGTLHGDIVLIGSGDPSFGSNEYGRTESFENILLIMAKTIQSAGITCVDGNVVVADGIFDDEPIHPSWAWDDLTNYYTSGAWGVNLHDNLYYVRFDRSIESDEPTKIHQIAPSVPFLNIDNEVYTGPKNSGDNAYIFGHPYESERKIKGTIPPGKGLFSIKGALPDPPFFAAFHLHKQIISLGIAVDSFYVIHQPAISDYHHLKSFKSPRFFELAAYTNEVSNNMFCEAFYRTLGATTNEKIGSYQNGRKALMDHLESLGLDIKQIQIEDGSGLSSRNRITPDFMTSFLHKKRNSIGDILLQSLIPQVGKKGSVRNFLTTYKAQENAWLKSGSVNNVLAYAGLLKTQSGELVSIAIMANGHSSNRKQRGQIEQLFEIFYEEF